MEHIASAQNSRIKHLAKLAASAAKRRAFGQTLLEGTHLLEAFLNAGGRPECVYVAENRLEDAEISALLQRMPSEKTVSVAAPILGRLTGLGEGGNIVALIKLPSAAKRPEDGDCVVLERVQDPGNIGTILRSVAASGVRDIVLGADCADVWSPKVLRAAMGAHFLLTLHPDTDLAVWRQGYRPPLLATPRGYCAGVDRAVIAVEKALEHYGAPVYVRKQIVHNRHVVETLEKQGAIFVDEVDEVPEGSVTVFSAHGVSPAVVSAAGQRQLNTIDATCPLVNKVHREAVRFAKQDYDILLIGHTGHEEVEGTAGEAPDHIQIVNSPDEVGAVTVRDPEKVVWISQTTLSVDETLETVARLRERFPSLQDPPSDDICYATSNRQGAIKEIAPQSDLVIVVGSANSSNSVRLKEVALEYGAKRAERVDFAHQVDESWFEGVATVGLTSGASVPEVLVQEVLALLADYGYESIEEVETAKEDILFSLPKELRAALKNDENGGRQLGGRGAKPTR